MLSVYLNTNPGDPQLLNGGWQIHLKNGFKRIHEYLIASKDENEIKVFEKLKDKVTKEIKDNKNRLRKSVVIFASLEPELWSVHYVQVPAKTSFHWESKPMTEEMEYMYKAYPEAGVILPSYGEIRILDTAMGDVKEELFYEFDLSIDGWKQRKSETDTDDKKSKKSSESNLDARPRTNAKGFFKGMDQVIAKLKKERGWREIRITGETDVANSFAETLREKPASCIYKNLNNNKTSEIISQVFEK